MGYNISTKKRRKSSTQTNLASFAILDKKTVQCV